MGDLEDFRKWLGTHASLYDRSARDNISRLKRAATLVDLTRAKPADELLLKLNRNSAFQSLTETVRSQIRRALRLYCAFKLGSSDRLSKKK
jgi:hypothetical protein